MSKMKSSSVDELSREMSVSIMNTAHTHFEMDEKIKLIIVSHSKIKQAVSFTEKWALAKVEWENSDEPDSEPLSVYVSHNIFRENWCVLAKDRDKLWSLS